MKWSEIAKRPTDIKEIPHGCSGVHESVLRSYQILQKVKEYLDRKVPPDVILELIAEAEATPEVITPESMKFNYDYWRGPA